MTMKSISEEVLLQNMSQLDKLKANIHINAMQNFIEFLRKKWNPETLEVRGKNDTGLLYWDEYNHTYSIKQTAFQGFIFKNIIRIIENTHTMENHKKKYSEPTILSKSIEMENTIGGSANKGSEVNNGN